MDLKQSAFEIEYINGFLEKFKHKIRWKPDLVGKFYVFRDRVEAGETLAEMLQACEDVSGALVLAIPNGGVPVGATLAKKLKLDFNVIVCRKLQIPWNPEAGFGAVAPDGSLIINRRMVEALNLDSETIERQKVKALSEVRLKEGLFNAGEKLNLKGGTVILVDDGLASGYTMLAALKFAEKVGSTRRIVAVPTASPKALSLIAGEAWRIYCANVRSDLLGFAVADAYENWYDVSDEEALEWLKKAS